MQISLDDLQVNHFVTFYTFFDILPELGGLFILNYIVLKKLIPTDILFLNYLSNVT